MLVRALLATAVALNLSLGLASAVQAQIAVSANDGKQVLDDGEQVVPAHPAPDSVTLIDMSASPPRSVGDVAAPTSVIGPPSSVAVAPDESFALVTAARRLTPGDPTTISPDDVVSVIDLKTRRVTATLHAGAGASGVSINRAGTLALVANRAEGTVSVFTVAGGVLTPVGKVRVGEPDSSPAMPIFFDDDHRALVSRDRDHKIVQLSLDGATVAVTSVTLAPGLRPYQIDTDGPRRFAVSGNIGGGGRDVDTISLIDLAPAIPRVVDTVAVGLTPEGLKMSPDGRYVAVNVNNGSNLARAAPGYHPKGLVQIWRIDGERLTKVTQADVGAWGQGIAWSRDSRRLLVQCVVGQTIEAFAFDGRRLRHTATLPMPAGPAAIRTAEP
ncbi:mandelate racemase [Caulobacter sp. Root655]|uniref:YncE family protein n=1 Tax=Caulobacter sp. Root655 TaxID=1736578 RepID=UPI0006FF8C2C|nr:YncE family protein [Caulobacter sp. Root655]KRA59255.1 mandelate racemase [Caulobacter sp. Root655]